MVTASTAGRIQCLLASTAISLGKPTRLNFMAYLTLPSLEANTAVYLLKAITADSINDANSLIVSHHGY
jgi:hypothetical protein